MAAVTPRASGLWEYSSRMSRYSRLDADDGDDTDDLERNDEDDYDDGRTPLDKTIDRIGMGTYQWTLLSLCGFGWMADNMWIQAIAIILPRVQQHFLVPDNYIGVVSSSMFAGMMVGAVGWGTCSDLMGRSTAFNATLFFTALFGIGASFANTFLTLCISLFFLGSAVGGSMPTDGTLLLEHMPRGKEYLVTALSVFFSFGAVLSALVAIALIPRHSCAPAPAPCDISQNMGWKYELIALGLITLTMFLARMVFFRLHESPRYLVHAGRPHDALESLQMISRFNGSELALELRDVVDRIHPPLPSGAAPDPAPFLSSLDGREETTHLNAAPIQEVYPPTPLSNEQVTTSPIDISDSAAKADSRGSSQASSPPRSVPAYAATGESTTRLEGHVFFTPVPEQHGQFSLPTSSSPLTLKEDVQDEDIPAARPRPQRRRASTSASVRSSFAEARKKVWWKLPRWIRKPLGAWVSRFAMVLSPEWIRTTILVWGAWFGMSLAYTMFNVYLPKLLEARSATQIERKTLEGTLWDVVIFTIGGCPGAVLGAWLIESRLGRRLSLAGSTFVTAIFCIIFVMVDGQAAVTASTVGISLSATTMWAVLYGWTPEIFGTKVRGTACGAASALSRIGGMIAPLLGGTLLMVDTSFPVYTSVVIFVLSGACVLLLHENAGDGARSKDGRPALVH
ncbi:MFS general substrate transporter [Artomyces pyxidatus]|uniref:MFS general substrate transporter n=1 Tax=Artomyces pyxidatus TaxID=48021 RepID=A0ACB8T6H7_9AGAM|nr:MFS general substrate transporter [Artomyces pyxidatus]